MKLKDKVLLSLCGTILLLTQFIAVREIGSSFFSTEIVTLLSVITILTGPSIAYAFAHAIGKRLLTLWGVTTFLALVTLPYSIRWLAALSGKFENLVLAAVFVFGGLFLSGFFALFLPMRAHTAEDFKTLYILELAGAVFGLSLIALIPLVFSNLFVDKTFAVGWFALLICFWIVVIAALHLAVNKPAITISACAIVFGSAFFYPALDKLCAENYLARYWKLKNPKVLETRYSPYQRIDVVKADDGKSLFLDGIPYYDPEDLHWFNYYIAELPGTLIRSARSEPQLAKSISVHRPRALVIGSGSLSSTIYLVDQKYDVTTVEIDREVARLGLKYFARRDSGMKIVYDDARRYINSQPDNHFDLIVLDIPAPYHIQTALLYTPDFLKSLKRCLRANGVVSINTCSDRIDDETGSAITCGAASVYEDIVGIHPNSVGLTILYCSKKLPFTSKELSSVVAKEDRRGFSVFDNNSIRYLNSGKQAHDRDHLIALLVLSRWMLEGD